MDHLVLGGPGASLSTDRREVASGLVESFQVRQAHESGVHLRWKPAAWVFRATDQRSHDARRLKFTAAAGSWLHWR
jgi:hypothetical protein